MSNGRKSTDTRFRNRRSKILYEITGLIVVVMVISGLATFLLVRRSQDKLVDNSINKLIETEADDMTSSLRYLTFSETLKGESSSLLNIDSAQLVSGIMQKTVTDFQKKVDQQMKGMVDTGYFDMEAYFIIIPPSSLMKEPFVLLSSDESMVYEWQIPGYLTEALEAGSSYILLNDGMPELGLEGPQLVILITEESPLTAEINFTHVSVIPMQEKFAAMNDFYDQERKDVGLTLGLSVLFSIIAVVLITFFVLNHLIRKRLTEPIELLSSEAEEVMDGNLDIDIVVHQGGEFQGLEKTFKNMVETFRGYIAKSMEDS